MRAAIGLISAKAGPSNDHVAAMLSTPVCGVEIRKEADAALDAPFRLIPMAVGRTPHEQSGRGIPTAAALTTAFHPPEDKWRTKSSWGTKAYINPAMRNPRRI